MNLSLFSEAKGDNSPHCCVRSTGNLAVHTAGFFILVEVVPTFCLLGVIKGWCS